MSNHNKSPLNDTAYRITVRALAARTARNKGVRAGYAFALTPATEQLAFPYTEPLISDIAGAQQRAALRRAAGIICTHKNTPAWERNKEDPQAAKTRPLGASFRHLHRTAMGTNPGELVNDALKRTSLSMQVDALPLLPMEEAAQVIALLVGRCGNEGIAVDFQDLTRTLVYWGNGLTPASLQARNRVVETFYGAN